MPVEQSTVCKDVVKQATKKLKPENPTVSNEDSYKGFHGPSARMFHPFNGRDVFSTAAPTYATPDILVNIKMTPRLRDVIEEWKNEQRKTGTENAEKSDSELEALALRTFGF